MGIVKARRNKASCIVYIFISIICVVLTVYGLIGVTSEIRHITPVEVDQHRVMDESGNYLDASTVYDARTSTAYDNDLSYVKCLRIIYISILVIIVINWIVFFILKNNTSKTKNYILVSELSLTIVMILILLSIHNYSWR